MSSDLEDAVESALARLDLESRVTLLSGQDMWSLPPLPEIGLRSLVMSDGPIGVRGTAWTIGDPSIALPSPTGLAAAWDPGLARRAGSLLGQEARRKGIHLLLAPTINLHRTPVGGRHFECYSEDPLLTGAIAAGFIAGVQEQGVGATAKHFVANDSETDRMTVDVHVSEETLRRLYLLPFERAVRAGVWAVMAAYNSVNGHTMTEHDALVNGVLKGEWGFDGIVVSDWLATRTTAESALGGLDVAMPNVANPWGEQLLEAVRSGAVSEDVVADKARRVLRLAARTGALDGAREGAPSPELPWIDGEELAREIAERSFVLARNDGLLPLRDNDIQAVAVIGIAAEETRAMGGGSAEVVPSHVVSLLDGLRERLGDKVRYAIGADPRQTLPKAGGAQWAGLRVTCRDAAGAVVFDEPLITAGVRWIGTPPRDDFATVTISGTLTPAEAGTHALSVRGIGPFVLRVGGEAVWQESIWPDFGDPAGWLFPPEQRVAIEVGAPTRVELEHEVLQGVPVPTISFHLGHLGPRPGDDELIEQAVALAAACDVAIVAVGTTEHVESEGFDRDDLALPGRQDELVRRVVAANPHTVVVVNSGAPVDMPWLDSVPAVLLAWFPGQQAGAALARVLYGDAEPGGRLPTTWRSTGWPSPRPDGGVLAYAEETAIGYRCAAPFVLPFGHGFGYTTWDYAGFVPSGRGVEVMVRNTGSRAGREVIQVYAGGWLAGFASVYAEAGATVAAEIALPEGEHEVHIGRSFTDIRLRGVVSITSALPGEDSKVAA
jgi:beta-glucosidase